MALSCIVFKIIILTPHPSPKLGEGYSMGRNSLHGGMQEGTAMAGSF